MTEAELQALIRQGESLTLEFKRDAPIAEGELVEAVVCLANTEGGKVLLGIEDDGSISGLHASHLSSSPHRLEALIANRTIPGVRLRVEFVRAQGQRVAVLEVGKASGVVQTSDGKSLHRLWAGQGEPECRPMRPSDIASRLAHLGQYDYSAQVLSQATWEDLDPLELERLRQTIERNSRADKTLLGLTDAPLAQALELVRTQDKRLVPTVAGMLLVGREVAIKEFVPTHEAAFQVLGPNLQVEYNEFYREPLIRLFERFEQLFEARNSEEEFSFGLQRIGVPLYPKDAFREALANALTHRDYALNYAVHVKLDPGEGGLVITSPGGFVEGVGLDNLLVTEPRPRNRVLADAFKRLGLVERTGRGVERIFEDVLALGRPAPSYAGSSRTSVRVLIPGGKADLEFVRLIIEVRERNQKQLRWPDLLTLRLVADEGEITVGEVARAIQKDEAVARHVVEELVELGLLESKGPKTSRAYHLSAGVYGHLGKPSAYVRRRGFDNIQREQMVINFVKAHGRITRSEVAELCHLTLPQAEYLIRKLRNRNELKLIGKGKNAHYTLQNSS